MDEIDGECFNCGKRCSQDFYCYGCNEYVCDDCGTGYSLASAKGSGHDPEDHLMEYDEAGA